MKMKLRMLIFTLLLWSLPVFLPVQAGDIVPLREYQAPEADELPDILYQGNPMECEPYQIRLMGQPALTKSSLGMIASHDLNFLILRVGLTNMTENTIGWLTPDSFLVQEIYNSRIYGTYTFNTIMSAKVAAGFNLPAFYEPVKPGQTMQTILVFKVFPGAQGWILTFSPKHFGEEEASCSVSFRLPPAIVQTWYGQSSGGIE